MCCLRYEQEAYEDLVRKVPKQGAFVETKDGYGTAVQVNLLRSTVKVKLDEDREDVLHEYKSNELAAVPGGRPKDGAEPPHVLEYVEPEPEAAETEEADEWALPTMVVTPLPEKPVPTQEEEAAPEKSRRSCRNRSRHKGAKPASPDAPAIVVPVKEEAVKPKSAEDGSHRSHSGKKHSAPRGSGSAPKNGEASAVKVQKLTVQTSQAAQTAQAADTGKSEKKSSKPRRRHYHGKKPSKPASES
jgi:hypothetical protein